MPHRLQETVVAPVWWRIRNLVSWQAALTEDLIGQLFQHLDLYFSCGSLASIISQPPIFLFFLQFEKVQKILKERNPYQLPDPSKLQNTICFRCFEEEGESIIMKLAFLTKLSFSFECILHFTIFQQHSCLGIQCH